ncbi:MAG: sulfite exporter TauE/SafE family protein [Acidimicrobiaceae bacterium]|nr:sulfite exporter TauE/SafE family protein [Acidimicrobiaceae bacterium]
MTAIYLLILGLVSGSFIGAVGVGGVIVAPVLAYLLGYDLRIAQAAASFSFLFTGIVGTSTYAQRGSIDRRLVKWASVGLIPGAALGALVNSVLPTTLLAVALALMLLLAGRRAFARSGRNQQVWPEVHWRPHPMAGLGLAVGFASALTGTGGPVVLVPILTALGMGPLSAVGASQASQVPIAAFASLSFALVGQIDYQAGLLLGVSQAAGILLGSSIAHRAPQAMLSRVVSGAVLAAGLLIGGQVVAESLG